MRIANWLALTFAAICPVFAQQGRSLTKGELAPLTAPSATPESANPVEFDPETLYAKLLSASPSDRRIAFETLGLEFMVEETPTDVRLLAVNLDSDAALERVLIATNTRWSGVAIFDMEGKAWRRIGVFACCGINRSPDPEPFVELKQTVEYGVNDVVVHVGGSFGTGVGERRASVYRMWNGRLYKVFETVESAYNWTSSEESSIRYRSSDLPWPPAIQVQRTRKIQGRSNTSCTIHRWDHRTFRFVSLPPTPESCKDS